LSSSIIKYSGTSTTYKKMQHALITETHKG
jgi:hypothetical protein